MSEHTRQFLRDAADLIEKRGHYKGSLESDAGSLCLEGAINVATCGDAHNHKYAGAAYDLFDAFFSWKYSRCYPTRPPKRSLWNDAPKRTKKDVIAALRGAAEWNK